MDDVIPEVKKVENWVTCYVKKSSQLSGEKRERTKRERVHEPKRSAASH